MIDKQLKEAEKLGFKKCIIPENNKKLLKENFKLDIIGVKNIKDAMKGVRTTMRENKQDVIANMINIFLPLSIKQHLPCVLALLVLQYFRLLLHVL